MATTTVDKRFDFVVLRMNANVEMGTCLIQEAELTFENSLNYLKELFSSLIALLTQY